MWDRLKEAEGWDKAQWEYQSDPHRDVLPTVPNAQNPFNTNIHSII